MEDLNMMVAIPTQSSVDPQGAHPAPDTTSMFPTEVYERIIDFLADPTTPEYPHHLALCCLTSRSWVPRSRFHLYFEVRLESPMQFEDFVDCLEINPDNSDLVRKLYIPHPLELDEGWESEIPLALAPRLKNVSTLNFHFHEFTSLDPNFFQHLSAFSTVTELQLFFGAYRTRSLTQMISAFPRLQKLTAVFLLPSHDEAATLSVAHWKKPISLRHLFIDKDTALLLLPALITTATPLITLHFVHFQGSVAAERAIRPIKLFLSSCRTLRTIRLDLHRVDARVASSWPRLSFSSHPDLRQLLIKVGISEVRDITTVTELVSSISSPSLQFLQLEFDVRSNHEILDAPASWEVLNEALLLPNVNSTREIAITMKAEDEIYVPKEEVFRLLPELENMNVVNFWSLERFRVFWNKL